MTTLAIHTPRGRENEALNEKCWEVVMDHFSMLDLRCKRTPDDHHADGVLYAGRKPFMLIEVKSRSDFDEDYFWQRHRTWLVTNEKIVKCVRTAKFMGIPFLGAMHIVQSRVILLKTIYDRGMAPGIEVRRTSTQRTINGGTALRDNAYIPMSDAIRLSYR